MAQVSYEEVNLMLRLYDMRREARLRQARAWFVEHFHPSSPEEMMQKYPQGGEENTYIRMVISYWERVVWDRIRSIGPTWPAACKNPYLFSNIEDTCKRLEAWREKRAPGSSAAMRNMMAQSPAKTKGN